MCFVGRVAFLLLFISCLFRNSEFSSAEKNNDNSTIADLTTRNDTYFTFNLHTRSNQSNTNNEIVVDCFGLGSRFAKSIAWFFKEREKQENPLFTTFHLRSRKKSHRDQVLIGDQFGLEWTDFDIQRKTVVIVHGFLSNGDEDWIRDMEDAFLLWGDVNVVVTDWSEGSATWNYYKAAINTRVVGHFIAKFFDHIANSTINSQGPPENEWGAIHFVGHSLGAHICSFAANLIRKSPRKWKIDRITGLDPAKPCFRDADPDLNLDKGDASFVDVIHTNGRFLSSLGLGIPQPIGHVDFYPNGGKIQPGCVFAKSYKIPLPQSVINQAICSHGRSYSYFTDSIISSVKHNCTFWSHHWDLSFRNALRIINEECNADDCSEMGINSNNYPQRGTFFSLTSATTPFCIVQESDRANVINLMYEDFKTEALD